MKVAVLCLGMAVLLHGFTATQPYHLDPDEPIVRIRAHTLASTGHFYDRYSPLGLISLAAQQRLLAVITPPGQLSQRKLHSRAARLAARLLGLPVGFLVWKRINRRSSSHLMLLAAIAATGAINLMLPSVFHQSQRDHYRYLVVLSSI